MDKIIVTRIKAKLDSPYITKPLHKDSISKVLGSNDRVVYRLYQITNDKKELHHFAEIVGENTYNFSARVVITHAFAGDAREQIKNIGIDSLLQSSPKFEVKCSMTEIYTQKTIFEYSHEVSTDVLAYNSMEQCLKELNNKLNKIEKPYINTK